MNEILNELDTVALTTDLPEHGLKRGDVGAIVHIHSTGPAFEVEFVAYDGHTVAVIALERSKLRALRERDIPHARELDVRN